MRQFDNFSSYHDNDGNLLIGRVRFCNLNNAPSEVFNFSRVSLGSVIYTNSAGRLKENVFLADHDYRIFFDRYTGNTTMENDTDVDVWDNIGSTEDIYKVFEIEVDTKGLQCISDIATLRSTDPDIISESTGVKEIMLLGYNASGDKESVTYHWDENCVENDDGGSIIKVTIDGEDLPGRWILNMEGDTVDVVHFGVFPSASSVRSTTQSGRITVAANYAEDNGYKIRINGAGYYDITGCTINQPFSSGSQAFLICQSGMEAYIGNSDGTSIFKCTGTMNGSVSVNGDTLRSSQNNLDSENVVLHPKRLMILDTNYSCTDTYSYIDVNILATQTYYKNFIRCNVFSNHRLSGGPRYRFEDCHVRKSWFSNTYDVARLVLINCYSNRSDWDTVEEYETFGVQDLYTASDIHVEDELTVDGDASIHGALSVTGQIVTQNNITSIGQVLANTRVVTPQVKFAIYNDSDTTLFPRITATLNGTSRPAISLTGMSQAGTFETPVAQWEVGTVFGVKFTNTVARWQTGKSGTTVYGLTELGANEIYFFVKTENNGIHPIFGAWIDLYWDIRSISHCAAWKSTLDPDTQSE